MRAFGDEFDRFAFRIERPNVQGVLDKDARRGFPGMGCGKFGAALRRNLQRFQTGRPQIVVEDTDRRSTDHVAGPGDRKAATGRPLASASSSTSPKVSVLLGNTNTSAAA